MLGPYKVGKRPERIDRIARRLYGSERGGAVEQLWDANPGLAAQGPFIAPGTLIQVPTRVLRSTSTFVLPSS